MPELMTRPAVPDRAAWTISSWLRSPDPLYVLAILTGAVLFVYAAVFQPYNQNEYAQMGPYGSTDLGKITSGTRQPPLDPLLGSLIQHVVGVGQLRQRLLPIAAGIGTLVLISLLLRRWWGGYAGPAAVLVLATQPLMVRFSAYTRPYALPLFLMILTLYAAEQWLTTRRRRWLVLAAVTSGLLPLARVPEPTAFLLASAAVLGWLVLKGRQPKELALPLVGVTVGALVLVGYAMYRSLEGKLAEDHKPLRVSLVDRLDAGVHGILHKFLPAMAECFPWWPVTLALVVLAFAVPASRRRLLAQWAWWPLLLAPIAFAISYYTFNPTGLGRQFRPRYATFFLPPFVMVVAAVAVTAEQTAELGKKVRIGLGALVAAVLVTQLPATAEVLTDKEAADLVEASQVLKTDVPRNAIVVFDTWAPASNWHQGFSGRNRNLDERPLVRTPGDVAHHPKTVRRPGPVYLLILDAECASSSLCDEPSGHWDRDIEGWQLAKRFDHFSLYEPVDGQFGATGTKQAMLALADSFGPGYNLADIYAAASLMKSDGHPGKARELLRDTYDQLTPEQVRDYRAQAKKKNLDPFR